MSVQLPREVGGLAGEAIYLGELAELTFDHHPEVSSDICLRCQTCVHALIGS